MKTALIFLFVLLPFSLLSQIDAAALMKISSNKVSQVKSLEYDFVNERYFKSGNFLRQETAVLSKRVESREAGELMTHHYRRLKGSRYTSYNNKKVEFEYAKGDEKSTLVDHTEKDSKSYSNDIAGMVELNIVAMYILGADFNHFYRTDPMNVTQDYQYTFQSEKMHGGTMCYEISMPYGKQQDDTFYWYIAKEDSLPRGYKFSEGAMEVFLKQIDFDPLLSDFSIEAPEDYSHKHLTERNFNENAKPNNREASKEGIAFENGAVLPAWEATDLDGKQWSSSDLMGKVTVLDFWGVWCAPCVKAMPKVQELYDDFKDQGLVVIGMDVKDKEENVRSFLKRNDYNYPIVHGAEAIAKKFKVPAFPTMFIIGKDGKLLHAEKGYRSNAHAEWTEIVSKALNK